MAGPDTAAAPADAAVTPDLSRALPDGVLLSVISDLQLFDAVALSSTCRRLRSLVSQHLCGSSGLVLPVSGSMHPAASTTAAHAQRCATAQAGVASAPQPSTLPSGMQPATAVAVTAAAVEAVTDAATAPDLIACALLRHTALARAAADAAWRWGLLPAAEPAQQQQRRGGSGSSRGRGQGRVCAPIEHAAYLALRSHAVDRTTTVISDGRATAFFGDKQDGNGHERSASGVRSSQQSSQAQQQQQQDAESPLRLLQGHFPPATARVELGSPAWYLPGRAWPCLRHVLMLPDPKADATADGLAAWPPKLSHGLAHAKWLDPARPALAVPAADGDEGGERAQRVLVGRADRVVAMMMLRMMGAGRTWAISQLVVLVPSRWAMSGWGSLAMHVSYDRRG